MIEKMKFITITGPRYDIDRAYSKYLMKYPIHFEPAMQELSDTTELHPYIEINPYKDVMNQADHLISYLKPQDSSVSILEINEAVHLIQSYEEQVRSYSHKMEEIQDRISHLQKLKEQIRPYLYMNINLKSILDFKYLKYRFGRFPKIYYDKFERYIYNYINSIFYESLVEQEYVYGIYFVTQEEENQLDAIYTSMHFERIFIPDEYEGTPREAYTSLEHELEALIQAYKNTEAKIENILNVNRVQLLAAHKTVEVYQKNFDIRKLAALTKDSHSDNTFYILCGFIPETYINDLMHAINEDPSVFLIVQEAKKAASTPPTKLKNPSIFRPFEVFIQMYGMPAYNELDPTIFVALTYSFMFGMMFGDVGQGLLLVIGGLLLYKYKKMQLAGAISFAGIFSVFFGFLYGSFFGFEDLPWLPTIWLNPMENVMTILIVSVAFGAGLILVAMILNITNGTKRHDIHRIFFHASGVAGFIFYGAVLFLIIRIVTGNPLPSAIILAILLGLPLLFILFQEPLTKFVEKEKEIFPESKLMFLLEGIVELFEVLLSYITNTISFVRVGAFALSHVGMMGVVLSLAHVEEGNPNILILVLGNAVVVALEGLVVGIQVLRLEYYEMFSRFYLGTGKEFKPY